MANAVCGIEIGFYSLLNDGVYICCVKSVHEDRCFNNRIPILWITLIWSICDVLLNRMYFLLRKVIYETNGVLKSNFVQS